MNGGHQAPDVKLAKLPNCEKGKEAKRQIEPSSQSHVAPCSKRLEFGAHTSFRKTQEGCGGLGGENPGAFPKAGLTFQQPFYLPESAQTLTALRAKGTLISEPRFSKTLRDAIFPMRERENLGVKFPGPSLAGNCAEKTQMWVPI